MFRSTVTGTPSTWGDFASQLSNPFSSLLQQSSVERYELDENAGIATVWSQGEPCFGLAQSATFFSGGMLEVSWEDEDTGEAGVSVFENGGLRN